MKKVLERVSMALIALIGITSCTSESGVINNGESSGSVISFSIAIPKGDPVTYAPIHDESEWGIESLWLYEFDAEKKLVATPENIKAGLTGSGPEYTYKKTISEDAQGVRQFIFVANEAVPAGIAVGSTIADLQAKLASNTLAADASTSTLLNTINGNQRIPMTGAATQGGNPIIAVTGSPADVTVEMTRIVARLDIANKVPNLVISDIRLRNANSTSFLLGRDDTTLPGTNTKVSGISSFTALPSPFDFEKSLAKGFYMYEDGAATAATTLTIEVTAKLSGHDVFYSIPFMKDTKVVPVKRNHIYRLVLGDGTTEVEPGNDVTFTIEDTPWNEVLMNHHFSVLTTKYTGTVGTYDAKKHLLTVDNAAQTALSFEMNTEYAGHTAYSVAVKGAPSWIQASITGSQLQITAEANTTGKDRTAVVEVTSDADANTKFIINVLQTK